MLQDALPGGHGDALVVGDPWKLPEAERWAQTSTGNLWYLVDNADVMNLYSPSGFAAFNNDLCMNAYYGATCPELLPRLFEPDPATGAPSPTCSASTPSRCSRCRASARWPT